MDAIERALHAFTGAIQPARRAWTQAAATVMTDENLTMSLAVVIVLTHRRPDVNQKMLADEGVLILKFWFHLSKKAQKKRLKALEKDPKTRWRVTETDWERFKSYDTFYEVSEHALRQTSTADAPWHIVEGTDPGAPVRPLMWWKALWTTIVTTILFVILWWFMRE